MRFLTPALFAAAGLYVSWFNNQHTDRALVLPALDVISPSVAGDMAAQGKLTTQILLGLAAIFLVWEVVRSLRAKRADAAE